MDSEKVMVWATSYGIEPTLPEDRREGFRSAALFDFAVESQKSSVDGSASVPEVQVEWWAPAPAWMTEEQSIEGKFIKGVIVGRMEPSVESAEKWSQFLMDADEVESKIAALLALSFQDRVEEHGTNWILKPDFLDGVE